MLPAMLCVAASMLKNSHNLLNPPLLHPAPPALPPQVWRELEESHRSGRDSQLRLRGLEEQLLAAQGESSKLNSQVRGVGGGV